MGCGTNAKSRVRIDVFHRRVFKLMAGNRDLHRGGDLQTQTFAIKKEKQLILLDRSSKRAGPLIGNAEGPRNIPSVIKPIVGVECAAVPIILRVSMQAVGA